tara:strand:- start:174 stop:542 length:369 start_codon:yes stop_codon:yes gene_type:complete
MEEILKEVPRYEMPNPRNYTNLELEEKAKRIKNLEKEFPNVPPYWVDMLYDYLSKKDDKELKKMINEDRHGEEAKNPRKPEPAEIGITIEKGEDRKDREDQDVEKHELLNYSREVALNANID